MLQPEFSECIFAGTAETKSCLKKVLCFEPYFVVYHYRDEERQRQEEKIEPEAPGPGSGGGPVMVCNCVWPFPPPLAGLGSWALRVLCIYQCAAASVRFVKIKVEVGVWKQIQTALSVGWRRDLMTIHDQHSRLYSLSSNNRITSILLAPTM